MTPAELEAKIERVRLQLAVIASCPVSRLEDGRYIAAMPGGWFIALPDLSAEDIAKAKAKGACSD